MLILLLQVEETKLNNHNTNDYETAHAGTISPELVHRHIILCRHDYGYVACSQPRYNFRARAANSRD